MCRNITPLSGLVPPATAEEITSAAFLDNPASNRVSLAIGYQPNGFGRLAPRDVARETQRFRLTAEGWRARPRG